MVQGQAHQWIHVLVPALLAALRPLGEAPARSLTALAPRLGVSAADAAPVVTPLAAEPAPAVVPASPLWPMTGPNGVASAPTTLLHRRQVIAARKRTTRSTMSCGSMPPSPSSFAARLREGLGTIRASPRPRPLPGPLGAGGGRIWAVWRARSPRWTS